MLVQSMHMFFLLLGLSFHLMLNQQQFLLQVLQLDILLLLMLELMNDLHAGLLQLHNIGSYVDLVQAERYIHLQFLSARIILNEAFRKHLILTVT